jgi:hypothetical protein
LLAAVWIFGGISFPSTKRLKTRPFPFVFLTKCFKLKYGKLGAACMLNRIVAAGSYYSFYDSVAGFFVRSLVLQIYGNFYGIDKAFVQCFLFGHLI